jgi:hypothetical protein
MSTDLGEIKSVISHLEMLSEPSEETLSVPQPRVPTEDLTLVPVKNITVSFYRYLYNTAGERLLWQNRRKIDDATLEPLIRPASTQFPLLLLANTF